MSYLSKLPFLWCHVYQLGPHTHTHTFMQTIYREAHGKCNRLQLSSHPNPHFTIMLFLFIRMKMHSWHIYTSQTRTFHMDVWGDGGGEEGGGRLLIIWLKPYMTRDSHISKILLQIFGKLARFENKLETSHSWNLEFNSESKLILFLLSFWRQSLLKSATAWLASSISA